MHIYNVFSNLFAAKSLMMKCWLFSSNPRVCSRAFCMFLFAILQRLGEECYHIWRVILINENLFVTRRGYGRLITEDQNKGESQVRANKEEQ